MDTRQANNGQRKFFPDQPLFADVNGITNSYLTWNDIYKLAQSDEGKFIEVMRYRGVPNEDDYEERSIPWISAQLEGIATNSFLSGGDYRNDHEEPPCPHSSLENFCIPDYWQGFFPPQQNSASQGNLSTRCDPTDALPCPLHLPGCVSPCTAVNSYADDWIVFVNPDPDYAFLLGSNPGAPITDDRDSVYAQGNYDEEHKGNLENEIEEWLLPGGFRPEPGDRIDMRGRLITDCGHDDWHIELHPIELVVSQHEQPNPAALGGWESLARVVVTGEWNGAALSFDLWPPARPSSNARLVVQIEPVDPTPTATHVRGTGIIENIRIVQNSSEGVGTANHRHFRLALNERVEPMLTTHGRNNVKPDLHRRLAATVHLLWQ